MQNPITILQTCAIGLYIIGMVLLCAQKGSRYPKYLVSAGSVLLVLACHLVGEDSEVGCVGALSFATLVYLLVATYPMSRAGTVLLKASEVALMLCAASQYQIWPHSILSASFMAYVLAGAALVMHFGAEPVRKELSSYGGLPALAFALVLVACVAAVTWKMMPLIPLGAHFGVELNEFAWVAAVIGLSSTVALYAPSTGPGVRHGWAIYLVIPAFLCAFLVMGDLYPGIALAVATSLIMVREERPTRRVVAVLALSVAAAVFASRFIINGRLAWAMWTGESEYSQLYSEASNDLRQVPLLGYGIDGVRASDAGGHHHMYRGLYHICATFGVVPGALCLCVLAIGAAMMGARSILKRESAGVMAPFLCVAYGVEMLLDLLSLFRVVPFISCHGMPFGGLSGSVSVVSFASLVIAVAIFCDREADRARGLRGLRVAGPEGAAYEES